MYLTICIFCPGADIRADDQTKDGEALIGLQAGTNKYATQKGMVMGGVRHGADIRADDMTKTGADVIGLQAGTNRYVHIFSPLSM